MTMNNLGKAALAWHDAGCSVWPPMQDGTKRPIGEWKRFMVERASRPLLEQIYTDTEHDGVGIICGKVSGNLEMLELEGLATDSLSLFAIRRECEARGIEWLWEKLLNDGYAEWTPSAGIHFLYRVSGMQVPGNAKVARRPATEEELAANPDAKVKTLAETRGEGGYVIVAPSGGKVHPTGDTWSTFAGKIAVIPVITREHRELLHQAIHAALDEMPTEPEFTTNRPPAPRSMPLDATRPGDDYALRTDWIDILQPHGWQIHHTTMAEIFWTRPGKDRKDGWSATTGYAGNGLDDRLYVWSSSTEFDTEKPYTKFGAFTLLEHHGDFAAAARALGARGYGTQRPAVVASAAVAAPVDPGGILPMPVPPAPQHLQIPQAPVAPTPLGRNMLVANDDRGDVLHGLTKELVSRWDADRLFRFGEVICERDGMKMTPLTKDALDAVVVDTVKVVNRKVNRAGEESFTKALIESRILGMILARPKEFATLNKLSEVPFVRPDGTVCTAPGYDESTKTFLVLDPILSGIEVPATPTQDEVARARDLLLDELLGDFPLHTQADKANALATLITPFVRDLIPTSPLAVIDAKEAGSGKNLLADVISILTTGKAAQTLPYTTEAEEQRKVITSAFRSGSAMLLFDEAHEIEGTAFARALTSHSYQDRILGGSNIAEFPNNRTWVSLGNQVQVKGDMSRRVYRVRLEYPGESPESRTADQFRHPDLRQWAMDHRAQLVRACLILVRAWFALGRPQAPLPFRMGSFERWQETLAGILWVAGVADFLGNVAQWRSESDFERKHQVAHLDWLSGQFGSREFTSSQVTEVLKRDRTAEHPDGMDDPFQENYARRLGMVYSRLKDRILDGYKLVRMDGAGHNNVIKWAVHKVDILQE